MTGTIDLQKRKSILVVGNDEQDTTIKIVKSQLNKLGDFEIECVDTYSFRDHPSEIHVSEGKVADFFSDVLSKPLSDFAAIWGRRFPLPRMSQDFSEAERHYALAMWETFNFGFRRLCPDRWINNPVAHHLSNNKIWQLDAAVRCGLKVPDTIITNNDKSVLSFLNKHPKTICKTLGQLQGTQTPLTVLLTCKHIEHLGVLRNCPAIFQNYIVGIRDVRVIIVGEAIFSAELDTQQGKNVVDWRADPDNPWRAHKLPDDIATMCLEFMRVANLDYGAFDFRIDREGCYYFLEINPGGQFIFIEAWTCLPISEALARLLHRKALH